MQNFTKYAIEDFTDNVAGAYVIVANAKELRDTLIERGEMAVSETVRRGKTTVTARKLVFEGLLADLRNKLLTPTMMIVKNGKSGNLKERINQHNANHFRNAEYVSLMHLFPCQQGLEGYFEHILNFEMASKLQERAPISGFDWFLMEEDEVATYLGMLDIIEDRFNAIDDLVEREHPRFTSSEILDISQQSQPITYDDESFDLRKDVQSQRARFTTNESPSTHARGSSLAPSPINTMKRSPHRRSVREQLENPTPQRKRSQRSKMSHSITLDDFIKLNQ